MKPGGTTPPGATSEEQASHWVRDMFSSVAHRYDFLNHLLSLNIDRYWRARTVRRLRPILDRPGVRVLDLCCGTGDLTLALAARAPSALVLGSDFCHPMLVAARRKRTPLLIEADALRLPFPSSSFDLVTVAFGVRNFANYRQGLAEMRRVLKPAGAAAILEFSQPPNRLLAALYDRYSRHVLPRIGAAVSGSRAAYTYLPDSVRKFPDAPVLAAVMQDTGFDDVRYELLTGGIAALHVGQAK